MKHKSLLFTLTGALFFAIIIWKSSHFNSLHSSAQQIKNQPHEVDDISASSIAPKFSEVWEASAKDSSVRKQLIEHAKSRRVTFLKLMKDQPAEALKQSITIADFVALPKELKPYFERPLNARGDVDLLWETSLLGCADHADCNNAHKSCRHRNTILVEGDKLDAYSETGNHIPVLYDVPLSGIRLGHTAVVADAFVRKVTGEDFEAAASLFPEGVRYDEASAENAALIAGKLHTFAARSELENVERALTEARNKAIAQRHSRIEDPYDWLAGDSGGDQGAGVDATPYQENQIDVLFIRIDFSDFPGAPISKVDLETTLNSVDGHLNNYSYGNAGINYTVTNSVYRMPSTGANYALDSSAGDNIDGNDRIQDDARVLAAADYTIANYDVIAVYFPNIGSSNVPGSLITYGGLGSIGGGKHWINGFNSVGIILHEFGHNYGMYHANYYHPEQQLGGTYQVAGSLEYGDIFDEMGSGDSPEAHFSHLAKNYMQWMPDSKVAEATGDATYTIYRFDDINAISNPLLAVKVPMSGNVNYWIGYRQLYTSTSYNLSNAAYVVAENLASARETSLIDMTPESTASESDDRKDAGLPVGGTYYDSNAGVRFNALSKGGSTPNQWIQVQVVFDPRISVAETNLNVDEQSGVAHVVVQRQFSSVGALSVDYVTSDGSASSGSDYYPVSGTLTWADGDMADKTIIISIRPDVVAEGQEDFTLTLSGVIGGKIDPGASAATVTLLDAGQRVTSFAPGFFNTTVYAIEPLNNGKALVGGNIYEGISSGNFVQLNADGSVDTSFVTGTGFNDYVRAIEVQDDGKILVGGDFTSYNGTSCNRIVRLHSNGSVDSSFVTAIGSAADNDIWSIAVETSGQILVGGLFDNFNGSAANGLVRLNSSGLPATALALPFSSNATVWSVLAEPDGKIMVGGDFSSGGNERDIIRLTSTGSRDASFNGGSGSNGGVYSVTRMPDGKYVLGGYFTFYNGSTATRCCRVNANGSLDNTFVDVGFDSSVRRVTAQADGKTLTGGFFSAPANRFERLTSSGAVDSSFDQGTGPAGSVYEIAIDGDGAIWVGGNFYSYNGSSSRPIVKIAGGISPYDIWVQTRFTSADIVAGNAAADVDPDGDGILNLAEMAMGTNPIVANNDSVFSVSSNDGITLQNSGGQDYLQIKLDKSSLADGAWFMAQFSSDLVTWSPISPTPAVNATYEVIENSATSFIVRDKSPISTSSPRFGRIMIKSPE